MITLRPARQTLAHVRECHRMHVHHGCLGRQDSAMDSSCNVPPTGAEGPWPTDMGADMPKEVAPVVASERNLRWGCFSGND